MGRPDGYGRWRGVLQGMRAEEYGKKRMSRETGLSHNKIVKYLECRDAEASADGSGDPDADGKEGTPIVSYGTGSNLADGVEVEVVGEERPEGTRAS